MFFSTEGCPERLMETKEQAAARAREYRIRKKDEINARDRKRWKEKRRYARRAGRLGKTRCAFCEILLAGKTVAMKHTRYCDRCLELSYVKRLLRNMYMIRWRQKKKEREIQPIEFEPSEWD
jgi:hypothetical protein